MLLPTRGNALRGQIERWLETHDVAPLIVGEFEDSALLTTFGRAGLGLFPAPSVLGEDIAAQLGAEPVGVLDEVREQYYAISNERRIRHPAVEAIRKAPVSWSPPAG
jgi:LysR family transcriptional activator of nhaA